MSIERDGEWIILTYDKDWFVNDFLQMLKNTGFLHNIVNLSDDENEQIEYEKIIDDLVDYDSKNGLDTPTDTVKEWIKEKNS